MTKVYKNNAIESLQALASYDFQKVAWLASSGPIVSSFVEDMCQLFDDTGLGRALKANETVFGPEADQAIRDLSEASDQVNYKVPPAILLEDPKMQMVREKAAKALTLIKASGE